MNIEMLRAVQKAINEAWVSLEAATSPKHMDDDDRELEASYAKWIMARVGAVSTYYHFSYTMPQIDQGLTTAEDVRRAYLRIYHDLRDDNCELHQKHIDWMKRTFAVLEPKCPS